MVPSPWPWWWTVAAQQFRKRVFYPAAAEAGLIPPPLRVHDLRHTDAAPLIAQGAHVKEIAARLGHKNPNVTLAVYAHVLPSLDERLAEGLEGTFQAARELQWASESPPGERLLPAVSPAT